MKKFILFFSLLLLPFTFRKAESCAGWDPSDISDFSLFSPEIIEQPDFSPFFLSIHDYYPGAEWSEENSLDYINAVEWQEYLNDSISLNDVKWLIYNSDDSIINLLAEFNAESAAYRTNIIPEYFKQKLDDKKWQPVLEYLKDARKGYHLTQPQYYYWEEEKNDTASLKYFLEECLIKYKKGPRFLRERYIFQVMRSYYHLNQYDAGIAFFEKNKKKSGKGSFHYRSLGYYAGCLSGKENNLAANLIYAQLYNYAPMRLIAFESFYFGDEKDWQECLAKAKQEDKLALWQMYSMYSDPLQAMEEMLKLDPSTPLVFLPLTRIVNSMEEKMLDKVWKDDEYEYYESPGGDVERLNSDDYASEEAFNSLGSYASWLKVQQAETLTLLHRLQQMYKTKGIARPDIWRSSLAYIYWLNNNYTESEKILAGYADTVPAVLLQNNITRMLNFVSSRDSLTSADEEKLYQMLVGNEQKGANRQRVDNASRYVILLASGKYPENSMHYLFTRRKPLEDISTPEMGDSVLAFIRKPGHSNFENLIISRYPINGEDLLNALAVINIKHADWDGAAGMYAQMNTQTELNGNPFVAGISDCINCYNDKDTNWTRLEFVKKMSDLKASFDNTSLSKKELAENYFQYASGLYNITWYGKLRDIHTTALDWVSNRSYYHLNYEIKDPLDPIYDCKPALEMFRQALALTSDPEFSARITWMCAKCEHNIWLENTRETNSDFRSGESFKAMKENYSMTKYYKEVINECGYFCTYITKDTLCIRNRNNY